MKGRYLANSVLSSVDYECNLEQTLLLSYIWGSAPFPRTLIDQPKTLRKEPDNNPELGSICYKVCVWNNEASIKTPARVSHRELSPFISGFTNDLAQNPARNAKHHYLPGK
ncbi:hypothetical protein CEXT_519441 [Caerostris extrusa]|uniref:Uncharacterized protein n=1 Tax=Caerostris extrusa TaxID=172846 RepID=A0AAV4W031_CAEEX|nr:hypothetical protein CEXT_519441 [Caerostris extrusa]